MNCPNLGEHAPTSGAALQHAEFTDAPAEAVNAAAATAQAEHAVLFTQVPDTNSGSTTPSATNQAQLIAHKTTPLRAPSNAALDCAITITDDPEELLRTVAWMQLVALLIRLHIINPSATLASSLPKPQRSAFLSNNTEFCAWPQLSPTFSRPSGAGRLPRRWWIPRRTFCGLSGHFLATCPETGKRKLNTF